MGAHVNTSCGLHVHVGFSNRSATDLVKLIKLTAHHERGLFASTGTKRREQGGYRDDERFNYCKSIRNDYWPLIGDDKDILDTISHRREYRYYTLNLRNLMNCNRTVEYRMFAGTTQFIKALLAVSFSVGLVQKAINMQRTVPWDCKYDTRRKKLAEKGIGYRAVEKLMLALGWIGNNHPSRYGLLAPERLEAMRIEAIRLATKYDSCDYVEGWRLADHVRTE